MKNNENKSKRTIVFIKTMITTLTVLTLFFVMGKFVLKSIPEGIPFFASLFNSPKLPNGFPESAYSLPESHDDDLSIGGGLKAPEGFGEEDRKELFYTVLIVGLDGGVNTDTIMVASYDGVNHEANVVGIQRDSKVNVKRNNKKINSAYAAGTLNGGGMDGGIDQLRREIKTIIGFIPEFYVIVDMDAVTKIVDAVGGVDVYVQFDMDYDDPDQNLHIHIPIGNQHLDGADALRFARYRKGNNSKYTINDDERIKNQQQVISSVTGRIMEAENIRKLSEFLDIFETNVYTNMKMQDMVWFADQINKIKDTDALSMNQLPIARSGWPDNSYEYLDEPAIVELLNETINPYKMDIKAEDLDIIDY